MSKQKITIEIITEQNGRVRLGDVKYRGKRTSFIHVLNNKLNEVIKEVIKEHNIETKLKKAEAACTSREETRKLISLGLDPKTRDITLVRTKSLERGRCFWCEGYKDMEYFRLKGVRENITRIQRRWSREKLDMMLSGEYSRDPRSVEKSVAEIEERINNGTFPMEFLKRNSKAR